MPPDALEGAMTMTESLTPQEAARVLAKASAYEEGLVQRTEGLTQMLWGLVTPAIFVTYGFATVLGATGAALALLWAPWVLAGVLSTVALWRSAALSPGGLRFERPRGMLLRMLGLSLLFTLPYALLQPEGPTVPLAIAGGVWILMSAVNLFQASPLGRLLWGLAGLMMLATATALAAFDAPIEVSGTASIVVSGLAPLSTGLYQTLRG